MAGCNMGKFLDCEIRCCLYSMYHECTAVTPKVAQVAGHYGLGFQWIIRYWYGGLIWLLSGNRLRGKNNVAVVNYITPLVKLRST